MNSNIYRAPSGDGQQADHLEAVLASQRIAFETVERNGRDDAMAVCVVTGAFILAWLLIDPIVETITSTFFGALK